MSFIENLRNSRRYCLFVLTDLIGNACFVALRKILLLKMNYSISIYYYTVFNEVGVGCNVHSTTKTYCSNINLAFLANFDNFC